MALPPIRLIPLGEGVDAEALDRIVQAIERRLQQEVRQQPALPLPAAACRPARGQYLATLLLAYLASHARAGAGQSLGVTEQDLYAPPFNFVFGQAELGGRAAVISLRRLKEEFYHRPPDRSRFLQRAVKEAVHELGHLSGISHCRQPTCVMRFSHSLGDTDRKPDDFCPGCRAALDRDPHPARLPS